MREIWKYIPKLGKLYQVSNLGNFRRGKIGSRSKPPFSPINYRVDPHGYPCVDVYTSKNGSFKRLRVHRLLLLAFRGFPKRNQMARHLNDIKTCNRLDNLQWGTKGENHKDFYRNGGVRGFNNPKVLLKAMKTRGVW